MVISVILATKQSLLYPLPPPLLVITDFFKYVGFCAKLLKSLWQITTGHTEVRGKCQTMVEGTMLENCEVHHKLQLCGFSAVVYIDKWTV